MGKLLTAPFSHEVDPLERVFKQDKIMRRLGSNRNAICKARRAMRDLSLHWECISFLLPTTITRHRRAASESLAKLGLSNPSCLNRSFYRRDPVFTDWLDEMDRIHTVLIFFHFLMHAPRWHASCGNFELLSANFHAL